ncbi:MAG: error-prone DNA polymerase, partial [Gammaproteobacteria bacterium]|nr:error-prone DNA polymerase [Gammaproteobacteria bacterium]
MAATAGKADRAPGRRRRARPGPGRRSPAGAGLHDRHAGRRRRSRAAAAAGRRRRRARAAAALAARSAAPAGRAAGRARRRRAHRERLVGRRAGRARLLHRPRRRRAPVGIPGPRGRAVVPAGNLGVSYAELHCLSNFSFLRGASHAHELVRRARELGYQALAIADECSMAGIVRAHQAARQHGLKLIVGTEVRLEDGPKLVLLAENRDGYAAICGLIAQARRAAAKGSYKLRRCDFLPTPALPRGAAADGVCALWCPDAEARDEDAAWLRERFAGRAWIAVELHRGADDGARLRRLRALGARHGLPLAAAGDVHMHVRGRRVVQDVLTAIRHRLPLAECGHRLFPNGERHLRRLEELRELYPEELLQETLRIAGRCDFRLDELRYAYPRELVPAGRDAAGWLRELTEDGLRERFPQGVPAAVRALIDKELALIAELRYEHFFLTVHDLVRFARGRGILCQGRGSAANSAVCYALGITEVDPARMNMLFERFISRERNEPPDIDVDFEHQRREEVIQYVYRKYGRERAALAATVVGYRPRSAIRDVGRALGLAPDLLDRLSQSLAWWDAPQEFPQRLREAGLDPDSAAARRFLHLVGRLLDFPRHLSQHVGGFVISDAPLAQLVPVENAAMPERTIIQWDKDDLEALGLLKVDVLALGMLSALRRALDIVSRRRGAPFRLADIPAEDPATYEMIGRGDTIGVFQIESRAQMAMLPRLKPRTFYDLVIEVAIVRPGPIQGGMVHPYLRRRRGEEPEEYPSAELRKVLGRTLGVPLFQEQVMEIAVVAAGFTPGEADHLRRSMAAWKRGGSMDHLRERLLDGMARRGYAPAFAARIFEMIRGFGSYGFPESHAASFALLAYASAWLKRHEPAAFFAAILNSLPMGFYAPAQLVQAARR